MASDMTDSMENASHLVESMNSVNSWAPVSEPGFLNFQISRWSIIEIVFVCFKKAFGKYVGGISRNR